MNHRKAYSPGTVLVLVGTKRGLFLLTSRDRETWEVEATALKGSRVFFATLDQRDGQRLFAADNGDFFGTFLRYSDDFGQTWHDPEVGIQFPEGGQQKLVNIWTIVPGRPGEAARSGPRPTAGPALPVRTRRSAGGGPRLRGLGLPPIGGPRRPCLPRPRCPASGR